MAYSKEAYEAAKNTTYLGMQGYLATITSQAENRFMTALVQAPGWLGGTRWSLSGGEGTQYYETFPTVNGENQLEDYWYWACGPEKGQVFMDTVASGAKDFESHNADDEEARLAWYTQYMQEHNCYFNWGIGCQGASGQRPEPNNANTEYCLSILTYTDESNPNTGNHGKGCSFYGTEFARYSWNDLANRANSTGWNPEGYIIEYGDLVTGNSVPPLHDGAKCRSIVGLTKEIITATVKNTEVQCKDGKDVLAVSIEFTGGLPPYRFYVNKGETIVNSYSVNGATTIYLPIEQEPTTYTIERFTSGTITTSGCIEKQVVFQVKDEAGTIAKTANIKAPKALVIGDIEKQGANCDEEEEQSTASIKIPVSGGDPSQYPLSVKIISSNGDIIGDEDEEEIEIENTTGGSAEENTTGGSTGNTTVGGSVTIDGLSPGTYTITITPKDDKGCEKTKSYELVIGGGFDPGNIAGSTAVCAGGTMPTITDIETDRATGDGTLEFRWYESIDNGTATLIGGANSNSRSYTPPSNLTPGNYVYTRKVKDPCNLTAPGADEEGFVQSDGSYTLVVNPIPTVEVLASRGPGSEEEPICGGENIVLNGSAELSNLPEGQTQTLSYIWKKDNLPVGEDNSTTYTIENPDRNSSNRYSFTATSTTTNTTTNTIITSCSATASIDVWVTDPIEVEVKVNGTGSYPATICEGSSVTLTASYNGDKTGDDIPTYTYTLKNGESTIEPSSPGSYNIANPTPGTYTLEVTSASCTTTYTVLTVHAKPVVSITTSGDNTNSTICEGQELTLTASVSNTDALGNATSYVWYEGGTEESNVISGATVASLPLSSLDAGTHNYYVKANVTHGEDESADVCTSEIYGPYTVTVYDAFTVSEITGTSTHCLNDNANLSLSVTANGGNTTTAYTYAWTCTRGGETVALATNTESSVTAITNVAGTYEYSVTVSDECGTSTKNFEVEVYTQETVSLASNANGTVCPRAEVTLTATAGAGDENYTYTWYTVSNGATTQIENATASTLTVSPEATTTYRVVVNDGCETTEAATSDDVTVNVYTQETVSLASNANGTVCPRAEVTLTATAGAGDENYSYTWYTVSNGTATLIANATESTLTVNPTETTTYRVEVNDGCTSTDAATSDDVTVSVDNIAPTFTRPADITIYTDANCTYDASVSVTGDVTDEADNCSTGINAIYSDVVTDGDCEGSKVITRTWSLVDNCGNSAESQVQTIIVLDNIAPTLTGTWPSDITEQDNYFANRDISGLLSNEDVEALYTDNCGSEVTVTSVDEVTGNDCGWTVTRNYTITDACNNTSTNSMSVSGSDQGAPIITIAEASQLASGSSLCMNTALSLTASANDYVTYAWYEGADISGTSIHEGATYVPSTALAGTYTYTVQATDTCGNTSTVSYVYTVYSLPEVTITTQTTDIVTLIANVATSGNYQYQWCEKESETSYSPITNATSNTYTPDITTAGTSTYAVIVTDENGCKDTADVSVNSYNVTLTSEGNLDGMNPVLTGAGVYAQNTSVTLTASILEGHTIAWTVTYTDVAGATQTIPSTDADNNDYTYSFTMPAANVNVVAQYTPISGLNVNAVIAGLTTDYTTNQTVTGIGSYTFNDLVTLEAPAIDGHSFTGWTISDNVTLTNGTTSTDVIRFRMPTTAVVCTANYTPIDTYALSYTESGIASGYTLSATENKRNIIWR